MDSITELIAAPVSDATEIRNESPTKIEDDGAATVKTPPVVAETSSPACQQQSPDSTVSVVDSSSTVPAVVDGLTETVVVGEASTTIAEITSEQSLENALQAASTTAKRVSFSDKAPEYIQPSEDPPEVAADSETPLSGNKFDGVFDFDLLLEPLPIRTALTQLLCLDDAGISAYLRTEPVAADAETSAWLVACAREDAAGRRYAILKEAIIRHILYSYCDVLYVLNPHCTAPDGLQPDSFARRIATNYKVDVDLAPPAAVAVPRPRSIPAASKTQLQKGDQLSVVLQRMREINPQVFEKGLAGIRVNAESCMLLDLLSMSEPARNEYILQCAVDRRLLRVDTQTQQLEVNPRLHSKCWMKFDAFKCEDNARGIVKQCAAADTALVVAGPSAAELAEKTAEAAQKAAYKAARKAEHADVTAVRVAWHAAAKAQNAAVKAEKAAIAAAAPPILTKKAKKKLAAAHAAEVAAGGPRKETENVVVKPGKKDKAQTLADMQDATKCMQRLMIEYKQMRPDCDAASSSSSISGAGGGGSQRKRGARGASHTTSLSREYRTSIICSLQEILLKVQNNSSQLGQLSEPHEYDAFLRTFDKTVLMIQQRLYSNPIPAPKTLPLPTPLPAKSASAPAPTRYSDYVNQLTTYVTNSYKYRMQPLVEPAKPTDDYFSEERNVAIIDRFVAKLLADNWGKLVEGDIRINAYNLAQGYITSADTVDDTIVETLLLRQCAMHSDIVRVFVFKPNVRTKDRSNPLGFVVRVLEQRNDRIVLGHAVPNKNRNYFMLHPTNRRVPVLRINKTTELHEISDQLLYMARITGWHSDGQCWGEIVRVIGDRTVLATNNEAILLYNKLEVPSFSETIVSALPSDTFQIPREEFAKRTDLTAECIFTIDPETARDLDDALSVKQLPNGNYEVGVHISDVTYFIAENGELDRQIRQQATSIYLVDNVYHMLPRSLCMTCSLLPGQDKLAFSVFWEMNEAGDVLSTRYARTVIRSCVQLSYAHAQRMLDEPQRQWSAEELPAISGGFDARHLVERVGQLHRLARPLRERRFARHCLKIDQPKIVFKLDEISGEPLQFERYRQCDSNWLIEEFMLLANQSVAQTIYDAYPDRAMLRNHMPPKQAGVVLLAEKLKQYDFRLDASTPHTISTSMYSLMNNPAIPANVMAVLTEWLTRPMNRAHYICSSPQTDRSHFALSIPIYTHFTSPIRRYPDVLVHRLLAAALRLADEPALRPDELETIAERCNEQKYNAKCASEASTELYFAHYVRRCKAVEMRAVVTEVVNAEMFELMLLDTGAKLKVVVPKHKPSVQFSMNHKKPLSGVLQFKEIDPSTLRAARVRVEVFAELLVSVTVTDTNVLKASIVPFSK